MGRWSQSQHRGGGGSAGITAPAPQLQITGGDTLEWEFAGADPFAWIFQTSPNGVTEWEPDHSSSGASRSYVPPDIGFFWRLAGHAADGNLSTSYSNVVDGI